MDNGSKLDEVGDRDGWRCWLCDEPVDPSKSVNDARGPSVDGIATGKAAKGRPVTERLAHRSCNTKKGAVAAVVPWPDRLFVVDPAPIIGVVERLSRKGGREVVARCPTRADADEAGAWLIDRLSRLAPDLSFTVGGEPGGGQFMLVLRTA
ncbi:hypothetical protein SAMN04515671_2763 [Nakamurella panacisegetis]|uniref:Uncharacterized protein n=1 Tax=Nakamurella panacisegetis TaxID=1090615 RepID=A0A1H0PG84_9ACTN|nr:hypothetical protein [Nakamurella panacisegetis]SDP04023.1 hypothetical protein SAMN04515671_2763 [Nakamurella panacisegetis]